MTDVQVLGAEDWETWRQMRLRALTDSPAAFGATYAHELSLTEGFWRERLAEPDEVSVLAVEDGRPVGMGGGFCDRPGLLHVVAMWVAPDARGRRVGHAVLRAIEDWSHGRGLRLHLDVNTTNASARRSYEAYGFVVTGETRPLREDSDEMVEQMVLQQPQPRSLDRRARSSSSPASPRRSRSSTWI